MKSGHFPGILIPVLLALGACAGNDFEMGTYGYDKQFFAAQGIGILDLAGPDGQSRVMVAPCWQGRVLTSTTGGDAGVSYGWVNHKFIASGETDPQFNSFGGEERFWIGPEGGAFSWFFKKGDEQVYANWKVPSVIDTEPFEVLETSENRAVMASRASLANASGIRFDIGFRREVKVLGREDAAALLGVSIPEGVKAVAYSTANTISNEGSTAWDKSCGMPSVWLLGCFNPTPTTTVFIPYDTAGEGMIVKDDYFGKIPSDRLSVRDGFVFFKIDGQYRAKIGLPKGRAMEYVASYDKASHVLTILKYTVPDGSVDYVNGQWGEQDSPFGGDVINSYNDGPTETGTIMGPFYEIETSSPAAALAPGQSLTHCQTTMHLQGSENDIASIVKEVFGLSLEDIIV